MTIATLLLISAPGENSPHPAGTVELTITQFQTSEAAPIKTTITSIATFSTNATDPTTLSSSLSFFKELATPISISNSSPSQPTFVELNLQIPNSDSEECPSEKAIRSVASHIESLLQSPTVTVTLAQIKPFPPTTDTSTTSFGSTSASFKAQLALSQKNLSSSLPFKSVCATLPILVLHSLNKLFESLQHNASIDLSKTMMDTSNFHWVEGNPTLPSRLLMDPVAQAAINLLPTSSSSTINSSTDTSSITKDKRGDNKSVYDLLDKCVTSGMGGKVLKGWVSNPSTSLAVIENRHDIVAHFVAGGSMQKDKLRGAMKAAVDLFRISGKLRNEGGQKPELKDLYECHLFYRRLDAILQGLEEGEVLENFRSEFSALKKSLTNLNALTLAVIDMNAAPREFNVKPEYDEDLVDVQRELEDLNSEIEDEHERVDALWSEETGAGLKSVRLEVDRENGGLMFRLPDTNAEKKLSKIDDIHVSKVLKNGVHFSTLELRSLSASQSTLKTKYKATSKAVVGNAMAVAKTFVDVLTAGGRVCGELDCLLSFAHVAATSPSGYVRPTMTDSDGEEAKIELIAARHPCVEAQGIDFIPNDYVLEKGKSNFQIITGPNMGGKSTYIRGCGAIVAMAQIGSFVPCDSATINICDCILARVGAGDAQQKGISTFMAEMLEASSILQKATKRSLIIIDELGRGTSTFDGYGLAWSISEYVVSKVGCPTLFATHFHELTAMEEKFEGVRNCHVSAMADPATNELVFLYAVKKGPCLQSFGIQVAELASIPKTVINEAKRKAKELEKFDTRKSKKLLSQSQSQSQPEMDKFDVNVGVDPIKVEENNRIFGEFVGVVDMDKKENSEVLTIVKGIVSP